MNKALFLWALVGGCVAGCASRPAEVSASDHVRSRFILSQDYDSFAGLVRQVIVVQAGTYSATFKDTRGVYYMRPRSLEGDYMTKDYSEAWIFFVAQRPNGGGVFPYNTVPAFAELLFPPGGTVKARRLKPDFFRHLQWLGADAAAPSQRP